MISRRTTVLVALCALAVAIPTSYSKGRAFEGRKLQPEKYIKDDDDVLNTFPIVFARTVAGGEPEIIRIIANVGLLLTGVCVISLGFDFARKTPLDPKQLMQQPIADPPKTEDSNSSQQDDAVSPVIQESANSKGRVEE
jgi:hypothetical protein